MKKVQSILPEKSCLNFKYEQAIKLKRLRKREKFFCLSVDFLMKNYLKFMMKECSQQHNINLKWAYIGILR